MLDRLNHLNLVWLFVGAVVIGVVCFGIGAAIAALLNRGRRT